MKDFYDATEAIEDIYLFCFFTDSDLFSFNKAIIEEKLIEAMDEEIHVIEKNDTCKLTNLYTRKQLVLDGFIRKKNVKGEV